MQCLFVDGVDFACAVMSSALPRWFRSASWRMRLTLFANVPMPLLCWTR